MNATTFPTLEELEAGLAHVRRSPQECGVLEMIVRRPAVGKREILNEARLDLGAGLVGDNWLARGSRSTSDGTANPDMELNVMNARVLALLTPDRNRWALAGDQLLVDFDLSLQNLPVGSRLAIGDTVIEVTAVPHTGCAKFTERFGSPAQAFVNSASGRQLRLRGLNARLVTPGVIRTGSRGVKLG
jgi:hypothetical protein